ncbi:1-acyl-sn-glycerol-3-phosphate acyltransferase [Insulibacter thermoxylanivorax]|uniref:1-acyl-sn-glycerol-3-phosphate acyltransferase n=1 Tax=Insulibacter thermoxylanivorax TaxID=2749268 RepID=A0A916QCI8_9BACL|nr:lysophospholipid acyltransferase family protein [Insulibacter thermoxylanivorax]GFR36868.1 1-acyl-sn-glycerol-3-phosphate acyltransferase [Insulibacter thermoxylanivorax]
MDKPNLFYRISRMIVRFIYWILFRIEVIGAEHIPKSGGVMICSNHKSYWDPTTLGVGIERPIRFMAKSELFKVPVLNWIIRALGAFPVKRGRVSKDAVRQSIRTMQSGKLIGIFPEGTRNKDELGLAKRGAAMMAIRADAVVIPAAIIGDYRWFRKMKVVYGEPIRASEYGIEREAELTEEIMSRIRQLITEHQ